MAGKDEESLEHVEFEKLIENRYNRNKATLLQFKRLITISNQLNAINVITPVFVKNDDIQHDSRPTKSFCSVFLAIAISNISDAWGNLHPVRALLDTGSQACFIFTEMSKKLGLKNRTTRTRRPQPTNVELLGA